MRRRYRLEATLLDDVAGRDEWPLDRRLDVKLLMAELPLLTQTILSLFDEGRKLTEIAELVGESYAKVYKLHRNAVAYLRERLGP